MCSHSLNVSVSFLCHALLCRRIYPHAVDLRNGYMTCFSQRSDVGHFCAEFWKSGHHLPCPFLSATRLTMLQIVRFFHQLWFWSEGKKHRGRGLRENMQCE